MVLFSQNTDSVTYMTQPVSFFCRVTIVLELYRENWQGGNIYVDSDFLPNSLSLLFTFPSYMAKLTFLWCDILVKKGSLHRNGMAAIPKMKGSQ